MESSDEGRCRRQREPHGQRPRGGIVWATHRAKQMFVVAEPSGE